MDANAETKTTYGYVLGRLSRSARASDAGVWDPFGIDDHSVFAIRPEERAAREAATRAWADAHPAGLGDQWREALDVHRERQQARALADAESRWEQRKASRRAAFPTLMHERGLPLRYVKAWAMGRGTWKERTLYTAGERVVHQDQTWLCLGATDSEPSKTAEKWSRAFAQEAAADVIEQRRNPAIDRRRPLLLLLGGVGTGKTAGAVVATIDAMLDMADAADKRPERSDGGIRADWGGIEYPDHTGANLARGALRAVYWSARERSRASVYGEEASAEIERAKDAHVLIIDEVGGEFARESGPWVSVLEEVVAHRYDEAAITILTANIDAASVTGRLGERIADRIREAGRVVQCGEKSVRRAVGSGGER